MVLIDIQNQSSDKNDKKAAKQKEVFFMILVALLSWVTFFLTLPIFGMVILEDFGGFRPIFALVLLLIRPSLLLLALPYLLLIVMIYLHLFGQKKYFVKIFFLSMVFSLAIPFIIAQFF